jgi:hypothetical protein
MFPDSRSSPYSELNGFPVQRGEKAIMKRSHGKIIAVSLMLVFLCILVVGCATSKQAREIEAEKKGFLVDYSMLEKGASDEALLRYINPNAEFGRYTRIMIDPVLISRPENATREQIADIQKLVTNYYVYLYNELGKDYKLVTSPRPDTIRIQVAITDAQKSNAVSNTLSSVVPIGMAASLAKDFVTGKPLGVGEATSEVKATDAMTGELLGAAADRRVGGKHPDAIIDTWHDANASMKYWAKRIRYFLCTESRGTGCIEP